MDLVEAAVIAASETPYLNSGPDLEEIKLFSIIFSATVGTIFNILFILAFLLEEFKHMGNLIWVSLGVTDMMLIIGGAITIVMKTVSDYATPFQIPICHIQHVLVEGSTYNYNLFFMLGVLDYYFRLITMRERYINCIKYPLAFLVILVYGLGFAVAAIGIYYDLDNDFCNRLHSGHYWFRWGTAMLFYGIPFLVTSAFLYHTKNVTEERCMNIVRIRGYHIYRQELSETNRNILGYGLFVSTWLPYVVVELYDIAVPDNVYYTLIWIGMFRSNLTSFFYVIYNEAFRRAIQALFTVFNCIHATETDSTIAGVELNETSNESFRTDSNEQTSADSNEQISIRDQEPENVCPTFSGSSTRMPRQSGDVRNMQVSALENLNPANEVNNADDKLVMENNAKTSFSAVQYNRKYKHVVFLNQSMLPPVLATRGTEVAV